VSTGLAVLVTAGSTIVYVLVAGCILSFMFARNPDVWDTPAPMVGVLWPVGLPLVLVGWLVFRALRPLFKWAWGLSARFGAGDIMLCAPKDTAPRASDDPYLEQAHKEVDAILGETDAP
jgi:hypothetical protein